MKPFKYKLVKAKAYFEKGYGIIHYLKYLIAFFGLASKNITATLIMGILFIPICFILGWCWYNYGWINLEIEVHNEFNEFVKEMRERFK